MKQSLAGRVAIITGAGRGIGRGIAVGFAAEGASVCINYLRDEAAAQKTLKMVEAAGGTGLVVQADVANPADVDRMVSSTMKAFGRIDVLVNNAGHSKLVFMKDMTIEEWDRILNLDLRGAFLCTRAVLPCMQENKYGRIIFIAGELAYTGAEGHAHVAAAKAGVVGFCKALAHELGRDNILANVISPGPIKTPLLDSVDPEFLQKRYGDLPVGHFGTVEDIARAALYLATETNTYVTGQSLLVNGGHFML